MGGSVPAPRPTGSRVGPEVARMGAAQALAQPRPGPSQDEDQLANAHSAGAPSFIAHQPPSLRGCPQALSFRKPRGGRTLQGWPPGHSELQAPPARRRLGSRLPRVKQWVPGPLLPTACRTLTCTPGGVSVFGSLEESWLPTPTPLATLSLLLGANCRDCTHCFFFFPQTLNFLFCIGV